MLICWSTFPSIHSKILLTWFRPTLSGLEPGKTFAGDAVPGIGAFGRAGAGGGEDVVFKDCADINY